jgi:hypothetical protein
MPAAPATAVKPGRVRHDESLIDLNGLLAMALEATQRINLDTLAGQAWDADLHHDDDPDPAPPAG